MHRGATNGLHHQSKSQFAGDRFGVTGEDRQGSGADVSQTDHAHPDVLHKRL